MTEHLQPGDRIKIATGEHGTIIRIDGGLAHIQLNSSLRKTVATAALKKIDEDEEGESSQ